MTRLFLAGLIGAGLTIVLTSRAHAASHAISCGSRGTLTAPSTCSYTMLGEDFFTVPAGVTSLHVVADGARGGSGGTGDASGGTGAQVTADISVTPDDTEYVEVGVGGGNGYGDGGNGGGLSGVYSCPGDGTTTNCASLVGGGGGGAGGTGAYGTDEADTRRGGIGGFGDAFCNVGGPGSNGAIDGGGGYYGAGGTCGGGGGGGGSTAGEADAGSAGGAGSGGNGGTDSNYWGCSGCGGGGGGGGGGGYHGGGGGGGGGYGSGGGGGGGASFASSSASNVSMSSDAGTPSVNISWNLPPSVVIPSDGATVSGTQSLLDAVASSSATQVVFELTGGSLHSFVADGFPTLYGWLATWDTTSVPNGTYMLQSVTSPPGGVSGTSPGINVTVNNEPPTTSVALPVSGTIQSGHEYLDARASPGVTSVHYVISGGPDNLVDQVISDSTLTIYGWIGGWDTASVPTGTYTLTGVASYAGGVSGTSPAVTVTVTN